jgi:hypothetical protein
MSKQNIDRTKLPIRRPPFQGKVKRIEWLVVRLDHLRHHLDPDRVLACTGGRTEGAQLLRLLHLQPPVLPGGADRGLHGP